MVSRKCYTRGCEGRMRTQYKRDGMPYKICTVCGKRSDTNEDKTT